MIQDFQAFHATDEENNPTGGTSYAMGIEITWQNGPLGRSDARMEPNGAFVETVIAIARERLSWYQTSPKFNCAENANAIRHIDLALQWLNLRTERREYEDVEGTHGADSLNREGNA